jgi:hypothetical protein
MDLEAIAARLTGIATMIEAGVAKDDNVVRALLKIANELSAAEDEKS